jgi:NADH:ubiquinone oxidoreductase subunit 6 (subunit J)
MNLLASPVYAKTLEYLENTDVATIQSLETLFVNVIQIVVSLAGVALFLMFIVGGFSFLFSGGDQKKLEQAKGTLTAAVIGLVIIVASYLILRLISEFTGVGNITKFVIPNP